MTDAASAAAIKALLPRASIDSGLSPSAPTKPCTAETIGLLDTINAERLARMRHNSRLLRRRGFLRRGLSVAHATDIMWALTSPELYELLVVRRRWSPSRLGRFVASTLAEALLATQVAASPSNQR